MVEDDLSADDFEFLQGAAGLLDNLDGAVRSFDAGTHAEVAGLVDDTIGPGAECLDHVVTLVDDGSGEVG